MDDKGTAKDTGAMRQHQSMARDGAPLKGGDFGCATIESMRGPEMASPKGKTMGSGERAVGEPVHHTRGKMPAQSEVDHGKHSY
jgi:hypothetical protein